MLFLSELIGRRVDDARGADCGHLRDLAVQLGERYPRVVAARVGTRSDPRDIPLKLVASLDPARLGVPREDLHEAPLRGDEIWLARDVLDTQVIDVSGRRLIRVGDVVLEGEPGGPRLAGVEIGKAAILRRLGLRGVARRAGSELVDWGELHLTSGRAHAIQLRTSGALVHRLSAEQLEAVVSRLPPHRAEEVIRAVEPQLARRERRPRERRYHRILSARRRAPS